MRTLITGCAVAMAFAVAGCAAEQQAESDAPAAPAEEALPPAVARAAAVARGIQASPGAVDSVLMANGLTAAGLDSLMYTIAEDSALAAAYTKAIK